MAYLIVKKNSEPKEIWKKYATKNNNKFFRNVIPIYIIPTYIKTCIGEVIMAQILLPIIENRIRIYCRK